MNMEVLSHRDDPYRFERILNHTDRCRSDEDKHFAYLLGNDQFWTFITRQSVSATKETERCVRVDDDSLSTCDNRSNRRDFDDDRWRREDHRDTTNTSNIWNKTDDRIDPTLEWSKHVFRHSRTATEDLYRIVNQLTTSHAMFHRFVEARILNIEWEETFSNRMSSLTIKSSSQYKWSWRKKCLFFTDRPHITQTAQELW